MLRITDQMRFLSNQQSLAQAQYKMALSQRAASTGMRINQPADDPTGAAGMVRIDSELSQIQQCQKNISQVQSELEAADGAMASMKDLLLRAQELAVSMSNDTFSADERAIAAREISQIREQLISLANTKHNDIYIFGGYQSAVPVEEGTAENPDDPDNPLTVFNYSTDVAVRQIEAYPGLSVNVSVSAKDLFYPDDDGPDALQVLHDLEDHLNNNDVSGVRSCLDQLKTADENLDQTRFRAGGYLARLNNYETLLGDRSYQLTTDRVRIGEADAVQTMSDLVRAQQALNSTIQVTAKMLSTLSLVGQL